MKVKELIEKLKQCNPEAEVIGYNHSAEIDYTIGQVEEIESVDPWNNVHYCGGYSVVEEEFVDKPIVYLTD